jgi:hypothetical protein
MTNGRAETLRILANAFDELEQLRCRLRDDSEHVMHSMDAARNEERAAVVAYVRGLRAVAISDLVAAAIERGEHLKGEL